jgi:hypothetical protein
LVASLGITQGRVQRGSPTEKQGSSHVWFITWLSMDSDTANDSTVMFSMFSFIAIVHSPDEEGAGVENRGVENDAPKHRRRAAGTRIARINPWTFA